MKKTVYFVRHGESETNFGSVWAGESVGLTEMGVQQSNYIAKRCEKITIDVIISSSLRRTSDTANIIKDRINKPLHFSDLFKERKWPSEQSGLSKDDPKAVEIKQQLWENFSSPDFRYSDEENFSDLKERVRAALLLLEKREEENILVVTHGFMLRMFVAYVVMGDSLTAEECDQFVDKFHTKNTGLTIMHLSKKTKRTNWYFSTWNDHAHLAD